MLYAFDCDNSLSSFPEFQSGEIINELETIAIDILEMILGDRFRYCPQVPLEMICSRPETFTRLPIELWKFWVSSRVDITLMERGYCASRKAKLVIECQSHWHDRPEVQVRDRKKARLLASVGVPLVYLRQIDRSTLLSFLHSQWTKRSLLQLNYPTRTDRTGSIFATLFNTVDS